MMPENKPMKMQWLNIDGRQVPSILPNYWNEQKNDWDITGTKNPLPIANYTQNASGVWLPTSESNPVPTQLTGSKAEQKKVIRLFDQLAIASTDFYFYKGSSAHEIEGFNSYDKKILMVRNTHDKEIVLRFLSNMRGFYDTLSIGLGSGAPQTITIPASGNFTPIVLTKENLKILDGILSFKITALVEAKEVPSNGSITVELVMWN